MEDRGKVVPVYIVEDHDNALPIIYKAIGSKKLPFAGTILIHFDAHPDLLSPNIPADECQDKEKLFAHTSIADWILPAIYMGHIGCVVWLRPPWSPQMPEGEHSLVVGRDRQSGHIRVASPLHYFISDPLYAPKENLENVCTVPLHVVTLPVLEPRGDREREGGVCERGRRREEGSSTSSGGWESGHSRDVSTGELARGTEVQAEASGAQSSDKLEDSCVQKLVSLEEEELGPPSEKKRKTSSPTHQQPSPPTHTPTPLPGHKLLPPSPHPLLSRAEEVVCGVLEGEDRRWLLDVDLDFFSTANPFKKDFTNEEYCFLERLYKFCPPADNSLESVAECVRGREHQLESLMKLWKEEDCTQFSEDSVLISEVRSRIGTLRDGDIVEPQDIQVAGMMTDLPHHISTQKEVQGLMESTRQLLRAATREGTRLPTLVTVARSSEDGYTPVGQVEPLQRAILDMVRCLCGDVELRRCYLDPFSSLSSS